MLLTDIFQGESSRVQYINVTYFPKILRLSILSRNIVWYLSA